MNSIMAIALIPILGLIFWLVSRNSHRKAIQVVSERDSILQELQEIEKKRQGLIDDAGQQGVTISTDKALKQTEALKEAYIASGHEEEAQEVERVIKEFREQNGAEIPIDKAYALIKEIENKFGQ
jgi:predicted ATP-grasp superfamily ATP-dependent carboligase